VRRNLAELIESASRPTRDERNGDEVRRLSTVGQPSGGEDRQ
jgi:hypothetical protein